MSLAALDLKARKGMRFDDCGDDLGDGVFCCFLLMKLLGKQRFQLRGGVDDLFLSQQWKV